VSKILPYLKMKNNFIIYLYFIFEKLFLKFFTLKDQIKKK